MRSRAPIIEFRDVTKIYGEGEIAVRALDHVDLAIDQSDFVAIMGPSGSGKSSMLNIVGCLDTPTGGRYLLAGEEITGLDRERRTLVRRHMIGFVFQGFNLLARTSAVDNVELPLIYLGMRPKERREAALSALARVGLLERAEHTPAQLSGGQQQRVAIARAIVSRPRLLVADEPTGNLDQKTSHEIMDLLTSLNRDEGTSVVMVTHEADIAAYAQRTITFVNGSVATDTALT